MQHIYKHIFHPDILEGLTEKGIAYQAVNPQGDLVCPGQISNFNCHCYTWYCTFSCSYQLTSQYSHGPLARYVKLRVSHAPECRQTFSPPRVSDPDMHHGTCVTHAP